MVKRVVLNGPTLSMVRPIVLRHGTSTIYIVTVPARHGSSVVLDPPPGTTGWHEHDTIN
jgi:hypothetical protein